MSPEDALLDVYAALLAALDACTRAEGDSEFTALQHVKMKARAEGIALSMQYVQDELTMVRSRERTW